MATASAREGSGAVHREQLGTRTDRGGVSRGEEEEGKDILAAAAAAAAAAADTDHVRTLGLTKTNCLSASLLSCCVNASMRLPLSGSLPDYQLFSDVFKIPS